MPEDPGRPHVGAVLLCVLLSLLLHALVIWLLLQMPQQEMFARQPLPQKEHAMRYLQIFRQETQKEDELRAVDPEEERDERERPFAKTNPDAPERHALEAEYVGARNTTAASQAGVVHLHDDREAPAMEGREEEDDRLEILEQERQEGDIESEQRVAPQPTPPLPASVSERPSTAVVPPMPLPVTGKPEGATESQTTAGDQQEARPGESSASVRQQESAPDGQLKITRENEKPTPDQQDARQARQGAENGNAEGHNTSTPAVQPADAPQPKPEHPSEPASPKRQPVYDPSLPAHMQPGFRTYERRSRSTGTFVVGRNPSLNVEATPRGRYEALLYRLIARSWYIACDEHRGDIIPGSLTISVCLNKQGRIHNLQLYGRRGASVLQQSFTFTAIRRAALPPMPEAVQKEVDSDLIEMLITFHFD